MAAPKFVERLARLPEVFSVLAAFPEGLSLEVLGKQFEVSADVMREDLVTFMDAESWGWMHQIFRPPVLEFLGADDDEDGSGEDVASTVRLVHDAPAASLGVEHLAAGDLAVIYTAGLALLDVDGTDAELRGALDVITETMFGQKSEPPAPAEWNRLLPVLQEAQATRRRVDIMYSRQWQVGIGERTIEPLRLVQTQRGWEVDAGPPDAEGRLRTFLLANMRSAHVREDQFELPSHLESRLAHQRDTSLVRMALAQDARWAPDMFAEKVTVIGDDEDEFIADLELLPPVAERVALLLLASGGSSRVLESEGVLAPALEYVEALLAHHEAR
ncbi:WYL domain-containing protein [Nocardioides islandensis]|uniref:WYL domain-containing protein n=1 Tax=Nocardioides islandensis TaxID=433663 RepID=A0A930YLW6_9ACTN|nr:WYL domain-containing protein [Nocardioides islandensis]MBF4765015.1 WYL domain-containing protein [Nocardioides islandensis]